MQREKRRSKDLSKQFAQKSKIWLHIKKKLFEDIQLFKEIEAEGIAEKTKVDEFSKKLKMREHLSIMLWHVIGDSQP